MAMGALNTLGSGGGEYCEICKTRGNHPTSCPLLQKYQTNDKILFCNLCKLVGHDEINCCTFELKRELTFDHTTDAYRVQGDDSTNGIYQLYTSKGINHEGRGGFRGRGRGGFGRGGRGAVTCYNCNQLGN
jgi:hypothetical protein